MTARKPVTDKMKWRALFLRYGIDCWLCGEEMVLDLPMEWHHVIEIADGGQHDHTNVVPIHIRCHDLVSAKAESQRSRIDRLEKEKNGLPKRKRQSRPMKSGKTVWPKRAFPRQRA